MRFQVECECEDDGRWLAEIAAISGVHAYGSSANEAMVNAEVLVLRVLAVQRELVEAEPSRAASAFVASRCLSQWPSAKAKHVLSALFVIGWQLKRSPVLIERWGAKGGQIPSSLFMRAKNLDRACLLARIAKHIGLR